MRNLFKFIFFILANLLLACISLKNVEAVSNLGLDKTQTAQYGPKTKEELESFLDAEVPKLMKEYHVPGFMVSYVSEDKIILNKSYGVKDVVANREINPTTDTGLVGSVSKVLVSTAVMQQVDRGNIRLDEDINKYLDFEIKNKFNKKITVRNVLQHTAGFEDYFYGQGTNDKAKIITFEQSVKNYRPKVVYEPGSIHNYSNYGYNLLGYIVQRASGQQFDKYVKENILIPLEMNSSLFAYNMSFADFSGPNLLRGYLYDSKNGKYVEQETGYWAGYPCGALLSNTHDLGNFMIMYLNDGKFKGKTILSEESVKAVQNDIFTPHKDLFGQGLGFTINEINGHRTVEKSGDTSGFSGQIIMFPDYKQGISYNFNNVIGAFSLDFQKALADKFYQNISHPSKRYQMSINDLKKFEGYYRYTRYNQSGIAKLMAAMSPPHNAIVKANTDGTLSVGTMFLKDTIEYEPISPDSFQKVDRSDIILAPGMKLDLGERMAFRFDDKKENVEYAFFNFERISMERLPWWQFGMVSMGAALFIVSVSLLTVISWSIGKIISLFKKNKPKHQAMGEQKIARLVGVVYAFAVVIFVGIMAVTFNENLMFGIPPVLIIGLIVPTLSVPVFLALGYFTIKSWLKNYWNLPNRILYSLFTFSVLVFVVFSAFYNLIGWNF